MIHRNNKLSKIICRQFLIFYNNLIVDMWKLLDKSFERQQNDNEFHFNVIFSRSNLCISKYGLIKLSSRGGFVIEKIYINIYIYESKKVFKIF